MPFLEDARRMNEDEMMHQIYEDGSKQQPLCAKCRKGVSRADLEKLKQSRQCGPKDLPTVTHSVMSQFMKNARDQEAAGARRKVPFLEQARKMNEDEEMHQIYEEGRKQKPLCANCKKEAEPTGVQPDLEKLKQDRVTRPEDLPTATPAVCREFLNRIRKNEAQRKVPFLEQARQMNEDEEMHQIYEEGSKQKCLCAKCKTGPSPDIEKLKQDRVPGPEDMVVTPAVCRQFYKNASKSLHDGDHAKVVG